MGVLEDIKDTFGDSDSSSSSGDSTFGQTSDRSSSGDQDLSGGFGSDDLGLESDQGFEGGNQRQPGADQPGQSPQRGQQPSRGSRNPQQNPGQQESNDFSTPNPQAGRPQQGNSSPQLSQQTQRKMENAGLTGQEPQRDRGGRNMDIEQEVQDLKQQNQQIIDLLEDIVDELRGGRRR
ncbi:MAG: hypothetical protein ABEJ98_05720 [Candidatus Nanohaloarchaea archaeon]